LARNNRHLSIACNGPDAPVVAGGAIVQVENLARTYGTGTTAVRALDDVSLDIRKGEFLSILGPSGCGKTTLLNILAGFDVATEGRALFNGKPILGASPNRGVVFQDTNALFPWMTVFSNVEFGLRSLRIDRKERGRRVDAALNLVGLADFAASYPRQLSGGMRQLAAIARIIVMNAELLLMDEPFAALDAITRQRMQKQFADIWSRTRGTVLFITHSVDEAIFLGDRVAIMSGRPGRIRMIMDVQLSRPRDLTAADFNAFRTTALRQLEQD
jgi:ABC-type nitrate/sulfonate/bicarbonate transport system ATPase subunit